MSRPARVPAPRRHAPPPRHALALALGAALLAAPPLGAQEGGAGKAAGHSPALKSRTPVTMNFVNADIEAVTRAMSAMIERPILVDPRVKGNITLYSDQPVTVREAYLNYLASLRGLGFAVVESNGLLKLVPEADAKLQAGTVQVGRAATGSNQVVTQIFRLNHENPNNLVAVLRPLISPNNTINANPGNNSLVITDYADNLARIGRIIAALDQPAGTDIDVIPLKHAVASDLVALVQRLGDGGSTGAPGPQGAAGGGLSVLADPRSNALIVRAANPARLAMVRSMIDKLDVPPPGDALGGSLWVVHLKNADAVKLAQVLRATFGGGSGGSLGGGAGASPITTPSTPNVTVANQGTGASPATSPVAASASPSTGGFVQADPATNSLIISAAEPLYRQMRALIDQLDSRRAQIYIESMIVEVAPSDTGDFGFQWQGLIGHTGDKYGLVAGTNFAADGRPSIISLTSTIAGSGTTLPGEGFNIGLVRNFGGAYGLAAIARALQTSATTNIVSTPNLVTLDNEEAKIVVGENVPFITGQFTNTGTATTSPFQTIERKDVGVTLRIKPQVGDGGTVRMTIFQEQSSVKSDTAAGTSNAGPSTTKRSIESTVVVDDGSILVLGGLIEDRFIVNKSKVPLLGDIPLLGALFRSESRERKRSNLLVFIRPTVMRSADDATRLSIDRYEYMRLQQKDAQPPSSVVLPINESPVMPPQRAPGAVPDPTVPLGRPPASAPAPSTTPSPTPAPAPALAPAAAPPPAPAASDAAVPAAAPAASAAN